MDLTVTHTSSASVSLNWGRIKSFTSSSNASYIQKTNYLHTFMCVYSVMNCLTWNTSSLHHSVIVLFLWCNKGLKWCIYFFVSRGKASLNIFSINGVMWTQIQNIFIFIQYNLTTLQLDWKNTQIRIFCHYIYLYSTSYVSCQVCSTHLHRLGNKV